MKEQLYLLNMILFSFLISCCNDDDMMIKEPDDMVVDCTEMDCSTQEDFYGVGVMNGECWESDFSQLEIFDSSWKLMITLGKEESNGIDGRLFFIINELTNLSDTIWLGFSYSNVSTPNLIASVGYTYLEDHSIVGDFDFSSDDELTYNDFLIIDYFNQDTSIVEGHFQVRFPQRSVNHFVNAPDSMNIQCGRFRVSEF
ncbi:hypothetical protein [Phaeodactylibacter xiamenensis]|uniref:hypothetical protein n=2 Tax=Phaeodactylibacter xiamenensis TaxID=1524460 RepID=UPI0024A82EC1|nr:hypothetical protein [Phaeodactylibacter xiamenensis]